MNSTYFDGILLLHSDLIKLRVTSMSSILSREMHHLHWPFLYMGCILEGLFSRLSSRPVVTINAQLAHAYKHTAVTEFGVIADYSYSRKSP